MRLPAHSGHALGFQGIPSTGDVSLFTFTVAGLRQLGHSMKCDDSACCRFCATMACTFVLHWLLLLLLPSTVQYMPRLIRIAEVLQAASVVCRNLFSWWWCCCLPPVRLARRLRKADTLPRPQVFPSSVVHARGTGQHPAHAVGVHPLGNYVTSRRRSKKNERIEKKKDGMASIVLPRWRRCARLHGCNSNT